jgi:hypothetical protein
MWTDRQPDMTRLIVAFRNFANARKKKELACIVFSGYAAFNDNSESSRAVDLAVLAYREWEIDKKVNQSNRCAGRYSNSAFPEY